MNNIQGKYGIAEVFTDNINSETYAQILNMMNQCWAKDANVKIMPDCHAGKSATIGTTMKISNKVVPNLISMKDYKEAMKGIYTTCVSSATVDESPMAYKPMEEIISLIEPTVTIEKIIKPVYNFKAAF